MKSSGAEACWDRSLGSRVLAPQWTSAEDCTEAFVFSGEPRFQKHPLGPRALRRMIHPGDDRQPGSRDPICKGGASAIQELRRSTSAQKTEDHGAIGLMESTPGPGSFSDECCRAARLCGSGVGYVASSILGARLFSSLLERRRGSWKSRRRKTFFEDAPSQQVLRRTNS